MLQDSKQIIKSKKLNKYISPSQLRLGLFCCNEI